MTGADPQGAGGAAPDDARAQALSIYARQFGVSEDEVVPLMTRRLGAEMTEAALNAATVAWSEGGLSHRDRSLVVLTALVVQGAVDARLRSHVALALENGLTGREIESAIALLGVYAGFPRASTAIEVVIEELERLGQPLSSTDPV